MDISARRIGGWVVVVGVCLAGWLGLRGDDVAAAQRGPPRHLLLIVVDTLRADRVGALGAAHDTTPVLDALAARGVVFTETIAPSPWTRPSMGALMTGLLPAELGLTDHNFREPQTDGDVLPRAATTLAEVLADAGFATAGVVANINVEPVFGFDQGFVDYVSIPALAATDDDWRAGDDWLRDTSSAVTDQASAWLADHDASERAFLYVHYLDPHDPYTPDARHARLFAGENHGPYADDADRYDAEVRQVDGEIGALLDALERSGLADDTLVAVVSDHGEEFGEHGGTRHGHAVYDELLRVPWLIAAPPGTPRLAPARRTDQVGLVDVAPTLLDALGVASPPNLTGASRLATTAPADVAGAVLSEAAYTPVSSLRAPPWKLIVDVDTGDARLYDLARDPGETRDVADVHPDVVADLLAHWRARREHAAARRLPSDAAAPSLSDAQRAQLEALGYVDG